MRRSTPSPLVRLAYEAVTLLIIAAGLHQIVWWMGVGVEILR